MLKSSKFSYYNSFFCVKDKLLKIMLINIEEKDGIPYICLTN